MSKTEWTPNQEKAFKARGMQVLVSAAAGSGKTAVLTERVKRILTDKTDTCSVSDILVVTFTRAAAGEMKDRIYKALKVASNEDPSSDHLREQLSLLPLADICTMDSFCSKLVKENFSRAQVPLDFALLDEKELEEITAVAMNEVVDTLYEENDEGFIQLTSMLINERDDGKLTDIIRDLYKYSRSYPSPELWLDSLVEAFSGENEPNDTLWADVIYKHILLFADYHYKRFMRVISMLDESGGFSPAFYERFRLSGENLLNLKSCAEQRNWDGMVSLIREGLCSMPDARNSKVDNYIKDIAADSFKEFRSDLDSIVGLDLPTTKEHQEDCKKLYPMIVKLCEAVKRLEKALTEIKDERNAYSFDDILHKAINLLVEFKDGSWERTDIAKNLQGKYKEIFIDEYQDTNQAQNIIFEAISRDRENLYCVGDVKQSIYKFRLASPQLFMELKKNLPDYDGSIHPSQITLDKNFRSRNGVTQVTNHLFKTLMSEQVGEIDYNEKEHLVCGATYPEKNTPDVGLMCLDYSEYKSADAIALEAEQIAVYIKNLLSSGVMVSTKQGLRPIESSDVCILLRSMKDKAYVFSEALKDVGISANTVLDGDVSASREIQLLLALVKVVNNPLEDIALLSVLFSPLFGFTADELAQLRVNDRYSDLYVCLEAYAKTSEKAKNFINKLQLYRNIAATYPINDFVRFIVKDTDISNIFLAGTDGTARQANIRGFVELADSFTQSGRAGLSAFVRSVDNAAESGKLRAYGGMSVPAGVQIMSIHKSKGLEFPYVIVGDCSSGFNRQDAYKTLKISRETGIGLKIRDDSLFTTYNTLSSVAVEKDILYGGASEALRVLYVAATRAKEHILFVCSLRSRDGVAKKIKLNNYLGFDKEGKLHPFAVYKSRSMGEWLLTCFSQQDDCNITRQLCNIRDYKHGVNAYRVSESPAVDVCMADDSLNETVAASVDEAALAALREKTGFAYTYDCSGVLAKVVASATEKHREGRKYFARRKPRFMGEEFTGAQRGTAIHKFFELCDFENARTDLAAEKKRLVETGELSLKEIASLDDKAVNSFFESAVGQRLLESKEVHREYTFAFIKKAGELYENASPEIADEDIFVQGMLDCAFREDDGFVLIDYKTDNISDEKTFADIYTPQLEIYSEAIFKCTGIPVKEKYIYSFKLEKFIKL